MRPAEVAMQLEAYDPFDPEVLRDPVPWLALLRREAPVHQVAKRGYWVITRYEDVRRALREHETFSSAKGNAPEPSWQPGMIATDPPDHTRLRNVTKTVFTPRAIERRWGPRIDEICDRLVTDAIAHCSVDGYRALSLPLPIQVIAEILGVSDGDLDAFKRWSDMMCEGVTSHIDANAKARSEEGFGQLLRYFKDAVRDRRAAARDDVITMLCQAGDDEKLTDKEIVHFLVLLLIAGNETTTNLIGNGLVALTQHPEQQARLRSSPERLHGAIEEMLRYCPSTQAVFRHTLTPVDVRSVTIPAGQRVMLSLASANRDEERYEAPDHFLVDREVDEHLAFGMGIHSCLGHALARLESRAMFRAILRHTRDVRAAGEPELLSTIVVRGPIRLPIELLV